MTEWTPIATTQPPKDGWPILFAAYSGTQPRMVVGAWSSEHETWCAPVPGHWGEQEQSISVTHWAEISLP